MIYLLKNVSLYLICLIIFCVQLDFADILHQNAMVNYLQRKVTFSIKEVYIYFCITLKYS